MGGGAFHGAIGERERERKREKENYFLLVIVNHLLHRQTYKCGIIKGEVEFSYVKGAVLAEE